MLSRASKLVLGFVGLASLPALGGCVVRAYSPHPREVVIVDAPPAPIYEERVRRPSVDHIWIDGHWIHRDGRWEWFGGHWEPRPRREAVWVPGHYDRVEHGYVWIEGRWR